MDILNATEQDVLLVDCAGETQKKRKRNLDCPFEGNCVTQSVWGEASTLLNTLFSGVTLQTLCQRGQDMGIKPEHNHR